MAELEGRRALVTGSSRGVGRMIAEHLLGQGASVTGISRGDGSIRDQRYQHLAVDVSDAAATESAIRALGVAGRAPDIVVNAAAVLTSQYAMVLPHASARAMIDVNLLGTFIVCRETARLMRRTKWGRMINISSMAASLEPAGDSIYAATKAGIVTFTNVLAKELGPMGVTCNTLAITAIETDMLAQLPRQKVDAIISSLPVPRFAVPDDILNVVDFLISERSSYITAQTVWLGGVH